MFHHVLIPLLAAVFLAINMGGTSISPSFSAAYGSNVIRKSMIPGLFGIMVFLGAIIAGKATASTLGKDLIQPDIMSWVVVTIILGSVGITLFVANILGIPQSNVQTTVFAISAPATYFNQLNTHKLFVEIVPTWFIAPLLSFAICFLIGKYVYTPIRKKGYLTYGQLSQHPAVKTIIVIMSLYVAFSIGANNVANAVGPIASMLSHELYLPFDGNGFSIILILLTLVVAPNFAIGASLLGSKGLENTGKGIFLFGPFEAIVISFVTASLLLISSARGIPTSLIQLNAGAIIGIGVARMGAKNIFRKTSVNKFFVVWAIAPIIAFILSLTLTYLVDKMGYL
ncbi:MAG: inorganic phosphate transporter family protein [Prolixibacteraceae bacterium]|nr:inorganic phosphate transporter family protein [Prolixibacteraceae bacterium]